MHFTSELRIPGIIVGSGIAIGTPFFSVCTRTQKTHEIFLSQEEIEHEILRYRKALECSRFDIIHLKNQLHDEGAFEAEKILDTHLHILSDPFLTHHIEEMTRSTKKDIETVLRMAMKRYENKLADIQAPLFKQRLIDIVDIAERIYSHLQGHKIKTEIAPKETIIFAHELTPSQVASMQHIAGIITQQGGGYSHTAIIAKAKGIPYLSSIDINALAQKSIHTVIIDAVLGYLILNPSKDTLAHYQKLHKKTPRTLTAHNKTQDAFKYYANIGSVTEIDNALYMGAEGIGLFRSEQLLMEHGRHDLSEEKQHQIYTSLVAKTQNRPCVIRAFDIGGDKCPPGFTKHSTRGMRFLLEDKTLFLTQARAIARLPEHTPISLLLPWVADLDELLSAKELIKQACTEANRRKILPIGCMVELPSLILTIDAIVDHVDFLSIGTNDLMQQTLGIDREDQTAWHSIRYLLHPSLIRMIHKIHKAASTRNIPLTLCGEIGSLPAAIPLLIGLGISSFSCTPSAIPFIQEMARTHTLENCKALAKKALTLHNPREIETLVSSFSATYSTPSK